jgi:hypothetical protein
VGEVVGAKDLFGLARLVGVQLVGDGHGGEDHAFLVAQRDVLADLEASANSSLTSSVIGIGQSAPSAVRMVSTTLS